MYPNHNSITPNGGYPNNPNMRQVPNQGGYPYANNMAYTNSAYNNAYIQNLQPTNPSSSHNMPTQHTYVHNNMYPNTNAYGMYYTMPTQNQIYSQQYQIPKSNTPKVIPMSNPLDEMFGNKNKKQETQAITQQPLPTQPITPTTLNQSNWNSNTSISTISNSGSLLDFEDTIIGTSTKSSSSVSTTPAVSSVNTPISITPISSNDIEFDDFMGSSIATPEPPSTVTPISAVTSNDQTSLEVKQQINPFEAPPQELKKVAPIDPEVPALFITEPKPPQEQKKVIDFDFPGLGSKPAPLGEITPQSGQKQQSIAASEKKQSKNAVDWSSINASIFSELEPDPPKVEPTKVTPPPQESEWEDFSGFSGSSQTYSSFESTPSSSSTSATSFGNPFTNEFSTSFATATSTTFSSVPAPASPKVSTTTPISNSKSEDTQPQSFLPVSNDFNDATFGDFTSSSQANTIFGNFDNFTPDLSSYPQTSDTSLSTTTQTPPIKPPTEWVSWAAEAENTFVSLEETQDSKIKEFESIPPTNPFVADIDSTKSASQETILPVSSSITTSTTVQNNEDDEFGDFSSAQAGFEFESVAEPQPSVTAQLLEELIQQERVEEAFNCQQQLAAEEQLPQLKASYEKAKQEKKMMEALEVRDKIERLSLQLQSSEVIQRWKTPLTTQDGTLEGLAQKIEERSGKEKAATFRNQFNHLTLLNAARNDLKSAITLKRQAKQAFENFSSTDIPTASVVPPKNTNALVDAPHVKAWQVGLDHCNTELENALQLVRGILEKSVDIPDVKPQVLHSQKFSNYLKGLIEIYRVACRLKATVDHYSDSLPLGGSAMTTIFLVDKVDTVWSNLCEILKQEDITLECNFDAPTDWSNQTCCSFCVLPLNKSSGPLVKIKDSPYHLTCVNFWYKYNGKL